MRPDRTDCFDLLLTIARRMRFLFGCFGAKDDDGDDTNPLIPEARPSVNEAPFPLENKPASLHVREEHRVVFKDMENGSKSADNNVDGDNNDMVLKDEVPFPLENKSASLHVCEEHRVVFKGVENGSQSADNNVGGDNDDMVLNNEVPYPLENKPASLHVHEEHRVVCKDVENASQSADNNIDGDNDDMAGLKDEVPFLLENKPASLHVQEENNVDGDDDYMVVLKDEVPFLLENEPASLHVHEDYRVVFKDVEIASQSEDNTVDGDNDDMVVVMVEKSSKTMEATPDDGDDTASKFHSLFTGTSGMKLNLEEQPDQVPTSPAQFHEEPGMPLMSENSDFPDLNSSSFDVFESPTTEVQRQNQTNCIDYPRGSAFASPESPASPLEMPAHSNSSNASPTVTHESPASPLDVPAHSNSSDASSTVTHESPASPLDVRHVPAHSNSSDASSTVTLESPASLEVPAHSNSSDASLTVTPELPIATTQGKKIVRFKCDASVNPNDNFLPSSSSPVKSETQTCNRSDSSGTDDGRGPLPGPQHSPYPTPLKLTDEMQTPGTVYPAKLVTTAIQNDTGIRYQSVYPFPTSMGNLGLLEQCPEEDVEQIIDAKLELLLKACEKYTSDPTVPDEHAERLGWDSISRDGLDFIRDDSDSMSRDDSDSLSSEDGANVN